MEDRWEQIDAMVCELGELYALEVEASAYPEVSDDPAMQLVHMALLRATDEMSRVAAGVRDRGSLDRARQALDAARSSADSARVLIVHARVSRNRDH